MLVADAAQSIGSKVYVLGGGWTELQLEDFPSAAPFPFSVVVGITVPWNMTNQRFTFGLELVDADGSLVETVAEPHQFEQGRPPGLRPGATQRLNFAVPVLVEFPAPGRYVFRGLVEHAEAVVEERDEDAVDDEARRIVAADRRLADALGECVGRLEDLVRGQLGTDDLDERHQRRRVEEVHPDDALGPLRRGGDLG